NMFARITSIRCCCVWLVGAIALLGPAISARAQTGACCAGDGTCAVTTQAVCAGAYQGDGTGCMPNPCPQPPRCCDPGTGACVFGNVVAGCPGTFVPIGPGACMPNPCPQPPRCCDPATNGCVIGNVVTGCPGAFVSIS